MEPNTSIALQSGDGLLGHDFADIYLKYKGDRIVSDILFSLDQLQSNTIQDEQSLALTLRNLPSLIRWRASRLRRVILLPIQSAMLLQVL